MNRLDNALRQLGAWSNQVFVWSNKLLKPQQTHTWLNPQQAPTPQQAFHQSF